MQERERGGREREGEGQKEREKGEREREGERETYRCSFGKLSWRTVS